MSAVEKKDPRISERAKEVENKDAASAHRQATPYSARIIRGRLALDEEEPLDRLPAGTKKF